MNRDYDTGRNYTYEFTENWMRLASTYAQVNRNRTFYVHHDRDAALPRAISLQYLYGVFNQTESEDEELQVESHALGSFLDTFEIKEVG